MSKKRIFKLIGCILAIAIVFTSLPLAVFASEDILKTVSSKTSFELVEKRTASTKTFKLENGSYYLAQYDTNIHYKDEVGAWQDIDNTLESEGNLITTKSGKIKFAKKTNGSEEIFTLHDGDKKVSFALNNARKNVKGIINNCQETDETLTELQKMTTLANISASILYEDVLPDTDLEYRIKGSNIKEYIIVKDTSDRYSYSFTLSLNNLNAVTNDRGGIDILDYNETVAYTIPAPIMWDSANTFSESVSMSLHNIGNGKYSISISADPEWMNAEERQYPITIDPPIYTHDSSPVLDLSITSSDTDYNTANSSNLYVDSGWITYWKLTSLPSIPTSGYITNAEITMHDRKQAAMRGYVGVYEVLSPWAESHTWNAKTSTQNPAGTLAQSYVDYQEVWCDDSNGVELIGKEGGYTWNITPIVKRWYTNGNYGLAFAPVAGTTFAGQAVFYSDDYTVSAQRPQLCITYKDMKGIEDYWSYSSQSAGFAGTGSVNNATGNLIFSIPTLTTTDYLMPFTPTLIYNSALAGKQYNRTNTQAAYYDSYLPMGFKWNMQETLVSKEYITPNGITATMFVLADSDGTEHYFLPTKVQNTYEDEDGLQLMLHQDTNTSSCTIIDSNHNERIYAINSHELVQIKNKSGVRIIFESDGFNRVTAISLRLPSGETIEQLRIFYYSSSVPYAILNPTSGEAVTFHYSETPTGEIVYGAGDYLRRVDRVHGCNANMTETDWMDFFGGDTAIATVDASASYTYDGDIENDNFGRLTSVTNEMSGYRIQYTYDALDRVIAIDEYAVESNGNTAGQSLTLTYGTSSTVIRTSGQDDLLGTEDDLKTTYGFDSEGRTVSCYTTDLNGTQLYGSSHGQYVGDENEKAKNNLKSSVQAGRYSSNFLQNGGFERLNDDGFSYWNTIGDVRNAGVESYKGERAAHLIVKAGSSSASLYQDVTLKNGEYTLSMYVKTEAASGVEVDIVVESLDRQIQIATEDILVNEHTGLGYYCFVSMHFTVDLSLTGDECERVRLRMNVTGNTTTEECVSVDNVMLSEGPSAAEYDMVESGNFENNVSDFWQSMSYDISPVTVVDSNNDIFDNVLFMNPVFGDRKYPCYSLIYSSENRKQLYAIGDYHPSSQPILFTVSGWAKGTAQAYANTSYFGIRVTLRYYDGTSSEDFESYDFYFDKGITDWQFLSASFASDTTKGLLEKIEVRLLYTDHPGEVYFDNISLREDGSGAEIYDYNAKGYLTSYQNSNEYCYYYYDDTTNNLIKTVDSNKRIAEYEYDALNRVITETHTRHTGVFNPTTETVANGTTHAVTKYEYEYNAYGQIKKTTCWDSSEDTCMVTHTAYNEATASHIIGSVTSETDALGQVTKYFYDNKTGRLLATIYPEGNGISYQYDVLGNMILALPASLNTVGTNYVANTDSASVTYTYDSSTNRLNAITTESTVYSFSYDAFGNTDTISIGNNSLAEYVYNEHNGKLKQIHYGNGHRIQYVYDALDRIEKIQYYISNEEERENIFAEDSEKYYELQENDWYDTVYSYEYDTSGNLIVEIDHRYGIVTRHRYDAVGRLTDTYVYDEETATTDYFAKYYYDEQSRLTQTWDHLLYPMPNGTYQDSMIVYGYSYRNDNGMIDGMSMASGSMDSIIDYTFDEHQRVQTRVHRATLGDTDSFYHSFSYVYQTNSDGNETAQIEEITNRVGATEDTAEVYTYSYSYDENGNITEIEKDGATIFRYEYDALGQLTREDNAALNRSYIYSYDNAGNILSKATYSFSTGTLGTALSTQTYAYDTGVWGDRLTSYGGWNVTYDEIGNPTHIGGITEDPDSIAWGKELEWEGRLLTKIGEYPDYGQLDYEISYTYNADGIRTSKTYLGITHSYELNGTRILSERIYDSSLGDDVTLQYIYDESGAPVGLRYRDNTTYGVDEFDYFWYEKNLQGDVIAIYTEAGVKIGTYDYDAWGNCTAKGSSFSFLSVEYQILHNYNPFRYRGYYYDNETGWYYLQSRYYNPEWGRFINADNQISGVGSDIRGYNLFAYCFNNPVNMSDPTGNWPRWITATVAAVAAVATVVSAPAVVTVAATVAVVSTVAYVAQSHHYDKRKAKNTNLPKTPQEADDLNWKNSNPKSNINPNGGGPAADCHQYTSPDKSNVKFVSPDGHREVIYNSTGNMVLDSRDIGTYNCFPSGTFFGSIGHFFFDMLPWYLFGNDDDDPGPLVNEIIRLFE